MSDDVTRFLDDLTRQERAEKTVANYRSDLMVFARWFTGSTGEAFSAAAVTPGDLRAFKAHEQAVLGRKPATINRRLAALRAFFAWAKAIKLIGENPTEDVTGVQSVRPAPKGLDKREVDRLIRAVERHGNKRDRAIVLTLRHTGLRVGELCALRLGDIATSERKGTLTVRSGKGSKYREIPLNLDARKAIADYLTVRPSVDDDRLFIGQRRAGLSVRGVETLVAKYGRLAGLPDVSPHTLRHSFGKQVLGRDQGPGPGRAASGSRAARDDRDLHQAERAGLGTGGGDASDRLGTGDGVYSHFAAPEHGPYADSLSVTSVRTGGKPRAARVRQFDGLPACRPGARRRRIATVAPSIFLFQFRLLPFTACINLNFDHLRLPGRFSAGCTRDVLMIKAVEGRPTFDELRGRIEIATESLLDAHAYAGFPTGAPVFLADLETWHEIAGCGDRPTTLGYAHSSLRDVPLASDNPERRVFDSAAALITRDGVRGRIGPALADFRRARRERSTYAAYYAFRVLEEIARNFGEQVDKRTWRAMNEAFGTDETHWHALTEHSRRYRHGAPDDPVLLDAKLKQDLLAQAYEAVKRMMDYIATSGTLRGTGRPLAEDILPFAYGTGQSGTHPGPNSIGGSPTSPRR